jgi:hypothetical protein
VAAVNEQSMEQSETQGKELQEICTSKWNLHLYSSLLTALKGILYILKQESHLVFLKETQLSLISQLCGKIKLDHLCNKSFLHAETCDVAQIHAAIETRRAFNYERIVRNCTLVDYTWAAFHFSSMLYASFTLLSFILDTNFTSHCSQ